MASDTLSTEDLASTLGVAEIRWDLDRLIAPASVDELLDEAERRAESLQLRRSMIASLSPADLSSVLAELADITTLVARSGSYVQLAYSVDVQNPASGAAIAKFQERATQIGTQTMFVDLEWAAADDEHAAVVLADPAVEWCRHHLSVVRQARPHLLSEAEEKISAEKSVTGVNAWTRLFDEQLAEVTVDLGGERSETSLEVAMSEMLHPDRDRRRSASEAITRGLKTGLRTRAYIYNTLLADKSTEDRLRSFSSWVSSRNLANQASDAAVAALVDAVSSRYDITQRWYALKAKLLGLDRLAFFDRNATLALGEDSLIPWTEAKSTVLDAFASFSPTIASTAQRFFDENWIDAPATRGKQGGAFCAPIAPGHDPFVLVNYTGTPQDVLTLAHELGHGVHFALAGQHQCVFELQMPLTVAETASVFGETVTFGRMLDTETSANGRMKLLAKNVDSAVATVFRQVSMWKFEDLCHNARRTEGELSVDRFAELWLRSQNELFGSTVDTDGYESWWSYVHHFVHVPGYVYAYAFGQLLALSVYERYLTAGPAFVSRYEAMLAAGGSRSPEALAAMVDCDLADPGFWSAGLELIGRQLAEAEELAASLS